MKSNKIKLVILLFLMILKLSFGETTGKIEQKQKQQKNQQQPQQRQQQLNRQQIGMMYNIRELQEISYIMDIILQNYVGKEEPDRTTLLQGAIKGMVESLGDPYTNYFSKEEMTDFLEDMKGEYAGVGMIIQKKPDEYLVVVSPIEDSPAHKAGIRPRDKIVAINGETTIGLNSEESVKRLKGKEGTPVTIRVFRESTKETKDIELVRSIIKLNYVKSRMLVNNIGYLRLTQFGENVSKQVEKELDSLKKQGAKGIILDLRNNPGGSLEEAIKISSFFVKENKIVTTKRKVGDEEVGVRQGEFKGDFPLVVLINSGSASASEIVSGAIKDYKRGTLIGEKTFGKGSVQRLLELSGGTGIKLTMAKYYTPAGIMIHGIGIEPDIKVEEPEGYMLFDGMVTNIDAEAQKENKRELIETIKGKEEAEKFDTKVDYQLERAIEVISEKLGKNYTAPKPPVKEEVKKSDSKDNKISESKVEEILNQDIKKDSKTEQQGN